MPCTCDPVPFETFLPLDYDPLSDDCSDAIEAAATWSAANDRTVVFAARYRIENCATVMTAGARFHFENARFDVTDDGASGTLTNGSTGQIGILFKNADDLRISGEASFIGQGTVGVTTLAGLVFDHCNHASVTAAIYFEAMAAGRFVMWCDHGLFGDIRAYQMNGEQTFDSGTAGTAEVVLGCFSSAFGKIDSRLNYKPIRYLSTAFDDSEAAIDNRLCSFGWVQGTPASGSIECSCLALRSAKDCSFDGCGGEGFALGLTIVRYNGDDGFSVDGNMIKAVTGSYASTGASVDAAIEQWAEDSSVPIGSNAIGEVIVSCAGEFGVFVIAGAMSIGYLEVDGSARQVVVADCIFSADRIVVSGAGLEAVSIGQSCAFSANLIDIRSGSSSGAGSAVRYNSAFGSGGFGEPIMIQQIRYRHNGVGSALVYVVLDPTNGPESWAIGHIDGTGSSGQARFANVDVYAIRFGKYASAAKPTAGTFTPGFFVWNSGPAIDGNNMTLLGWSRLTSGSGHVSGTDWAIARTSTVSPAT